MNQFNFNSRNYNISDAKVVNEKSLMTYTFGWMFLALVISAVVSLAFANVPSLTSMMFKVDDYGQPVGLSIFAYVAMFSPLAITLVMNFGFNRLSFGALAGLFIGYAALLGVSLSTIFFVYSLPSIVTVFFSSAALFGFMAVIGATTKTDLTKFGSILMMALFGIIIASLINMFVGSAGLDYIISILGVIIFTGLAAYHTQQLKELSAQSDGSTTFKKLSIISALSLYITFINLFLFLLRLFGGKRD